jgi:hypothetical protein
MVPLILAALAITFEFGRALWAHHVLAENVRSAARYYSRSDLSAASRTAAENIVETGDPSHSGTFWGETVTVEFWPSGANAPIRTFTAANFRLDGQVVRVEATVPLPITMLSIIGMDSTLDLAAATEARYIGD